MYVDAHWLSRLVRALLGAAASENMFVTVVALKASDPAYQCTGARWPNDATDYRLAWQRAEAALGLVHRLAGDCRQIKRQLPPAALIVGTPRKVIAVVGLDFRNVDPTQATERVIGALSKLEHAVLGGEDTRWAHELRWALLGAA